MLVDVTTDERMDSDFILRLCIRIHRKLYSVYRRHYPDPCKAVRTDYTPCDTDFLCDHDRMVVFTGDTASEKCEADTLPASEEKYHQTQLPQVICYFYEIEKE